MEAKDAIDNISKLGWDDRLHGIQDTLKRLSNEDINSYDCCDIIASKIDTSTLRNILELSRKKKGK